MVQLSHPYMTTGKTIALTLWTFVRKLMFLLLNMLSRLVIAFLPRRRHLLISWLQSPSAVILEPKKVKSVTVSIVSPSICHEVMGPDAIILVFWMLSFRPALPLSCFTYITRLFSSSLLSAIRVVLTVLTVASWPEYRFLKRHVRWSGIPISLRIFHSLLWSTQSKALADVLKLVDEV